MASQYAHPDAVTGTPSPGASSESPLPTPILLAFRETSVGTALIAVSPAGVRAIFLGDDRASLLREWKSCAGSMHVHSTDSVRDDWAEKLADAVAEWLDSPGSDLTVPLHVEGSDFQRAVWNALREIPCGTTSTYSAIAQRIGRPRAVRAVANACAMNALAVVIPCHRVLRSDGNISGYRWGVERKRQLLTRESLLRDRGLRTALS